jgi:hypothetical protein
MTTYYVSLVETIAVGPRTMCGMRVVFQCSADDFEHAEKQARSTYPDCIIISIDKEKQSGIHDSKSK